MKRILRYRPSGAMIVAIVALVLAAAGSATAAGLITSADIKNNTIRSGDIRNNTVRSRDVRNHTLLRRDFKPGVLVPGPRGATGAAGRNGTNGFGTLAYPFDSDVLATANSEELDAVCPNGTFPTGGAASAFDDATSNDVGDAVIQSQ